MLRPSMRYRQRSSAFGGYPRKSVMRLSSILPENGPEILEIISADGQQAVDGRDPLDFPVALVVAEPDFEDMAGVDAAVALEADETALLPDGG